MNELDITSAETKATYMEIQQYVLKETGLMVSNLYIAQAKQKFDIIKRGNYNKLKSEHSRQPQCLPEKEAVIIVALKHFKWFAFCRAGTRAFRTGKRSPRRIQKSGGCR